MKKTISLLVSFLFILIAAKSQGTVITMSTSKAIGSNISFYLRANVSSTFQVDFGDGTLIDKVINTSFTLINGTITGSPTIRIYGSGITGIDCSSNQISSIDVSGNTSLQILKCSSNQLTMLDVSMNPGLTYLDAEHNQISSLDVSGNSLLEYIYFSYNQLTTLDVTKNTKITTLFLSHNKLTAIDVSKNVSLQSFYVDYNKINTIDLTMNTALIYLGCENNLLSQLDVSKNINITSLYCGNNLLTSLDLTKNITLSSLRFINNSLSSVDITKNVSLTSINCSYNQLSTLDISKNTKLSSIFCANNNLSFATLPFKNQTLTIYDYAPQNAIQIDKDYGTGFLINLKSQYYIKTDTSTYVWKTKGGVTLIKGTDYTIYEGKTKFLKPQTDSVFCEITNPLFPGFYGSMTLKTSYTKITLLIPSISIGVNSGLSPTVSFDLMTNTPNTPITIDFGDGIAVKKNIGTEIVNINGTVGESKVVRIFGTGIEYLKLKIIAVTSIDISNVKSLKTFISNLNTLKSLNISQNTALTTLICNRNLLTSLDVTSNTGLVTLECFGNELKTLNLTQNTALTKLDCSGNQLETLDLTTNIALDTINCSDNLIYFFYLPQSLALTFLSCYNNKIPILDITKNPDLTFLNCSKNQIHNFDLSKNSKLRYLSCNTNELATLDLTKNPLLAFVYCTANNLTSLDVSQSSNLITLDCFNNQLSKFDVSKSSLLDTLICIWNQLTELNVSQNHLLRYLDCYDNNLTVLDVTKNPILTKLECSKNRISSLNLTQNPELNSLSCSENMLTMLDLTQNKKLKRLVCYKNKLLSIDLTQCKVITSVQCDQNQLTDLDVSNCTEVYSLIFGSNKISSIDVSRNLKLTTLWCQMNQIKTLGVRNNKELDNLFCAGNFLKSLDITQNTKLAKLYCSANQLTTIDVSKNTKLTVVECAGNQFTFATLPFKQYSWSSYVYSPQNDIPIAKDFSFGTEIDLSSQLITPTSTNYTWKTKGGITLAKGTDYTINNGKTVFLKALVDSVRCEMTNTNFPKFTGGYELKTNYTRISTTGKQPQTITFSAIPAKYVNDAPSELTASASSNLPVSFTSSDPSIASIDGKTVTIHKSGTITITALQPGDNSWDTATATQSFVVKELEPFIVLTTTKPVGSEFYVSLTANAPYTVIQVDFGDGILVDRTITTVWSYIRGTLGSSQTIKIYGSGVIDLTCSSSQITSLDITRYPALKILDCSRNQLTALDVTQNIALTQLNCSYNPILILDITLNTKLTDLWCVDNQLTSLNVTNNTLLAHIFCHDNYLSTLDVTQNTGLINLGCAYNKLTALDLTHNLNLSNLYCHHNLLTSLDVTHNVGLYTLDCYSNQLTSLDVSKNSRLVHLDCNSNKLNFKTLPLNQIAWSTYVYAPQQKISIATDIQPFVEADLSDHNSINGNNTIYTWKTKYGATLIENIDYHITDGKTTFLKSQTDSVFCEMTNSTFPDFNGTDALKTICAKVWVVNKQTQTITFNSLPTKNAGDAPFELTASASSNLPVIFTSFDPSVVSIVGTTVTIHKAGSVTITATQAGDGNWISATTTQTLSVDKQTQTIVFNSLSTINAGDSSFELTASASSNLPVIFTSSDPSVVSIVGTTVTIHKAGSVTITAIQAGDGNWISATTTQTLSVDKQTQTIVFTSLPTKNAGDLPFELTASASSDLPVTFTSSDPSVVSIVGTTVTIHKAGSVTITAIQAGDGNWISATTTQTLSVDKQSQTIVFTSLPTKNAGDLPFELTASASSDLPVTFTSSDPSVVSIVGTTVTIHKAGSVTITATQAGNDMWDSEIVFQALIIESVTGITSKEGIPLLIYPNPVDNILCLKGDDLENNNVSIFNESGILVWTGIVRKQRLEISNLPCGFYILKINNKEGKGKVVRFLKH